MRVSMCDNIRLSIEGSGCTPAEPSRRGAGLPDEPRLFAVAAGRGSLSEASCGRKIIGPTPAGCGETGDRMVFPPVACSEAGNSHPRPVRSRPSCPIAAGRRISPQAGRHARVVCPFSILHSQFCPVVPSTWATPGFCRAQDV